MDQYVSGFAFTGDKEPMEHVLLVEKKKPDFMAGTYNGIGGTIEKPETAVEAMVREFAEETGIGVEDWTKFAVLHRPFAIIICFYTVLDSKGKPHKLNDIGEMIRWQDYWRNNDQNVPYFETVPMLLQLAALVPTEAVHITLHDVPR